MKVHPCSNKKCLGNFDGYCRQVKLRCFNHITKGTNENKYYENQDLLEDK